MRRNSCAAVLGQHPRVAQNAVSADTSTTAEMGADEMRARRATIQSTRTELRNYLGATSTHR